ncbi:Uncharacterized protein TPAR_02846 [Tolypocladium paradoxum]|uniref:Uncharacterized protein n=1 Tax=Tolypocladium paradoxum TaxID=94208 RepID=A0A2S4L3E2_9HYPO|nr:Uncharacterized protein TPAR_02846 [Tolypocladium paradoxum]
MSFTRLVSSPARGQQPGRWPMAEISDLRTHKYDALTPPTSGPQGETATASRSSGINKFDVSMTEDGPRSALATPMSTPTDPSSSRNASTQLPGFIGLSAATPLSPSTAFSVSSTAASIRDVRLPTGAARTDANEPAPSHKTPDGLSNGATAAIVVGILLVLAAFLYAIWIAIQNKKSDRRTRSTIFPSYDADLPLRDLARTDEYRHTGTSAQTRVRFGGSPRSEQFAPETVMPLHSRDGMAGYGEANGELTSPRYPANAYWGQSVAWG